MSKTPNDVVQEFSNAQAILESKRQTAIAELLGQRQAIDDHLVALGYHGTALAVSEPSLTKTKSAKSKKMGSKSGADRFCSICSVGGHDARSHRSQGKRKKPFTQAELDALNA